uniref:protein SLC31A2 isoform X2 n=1 Tax=Pristiophorus japonicus TaxID=55135 RepID=UPI00398F3923
MSMHFFVSDRVILLFDFWNVHSVAGMALTAMAVLFITVFYEILKVELVKLDKKMLDLMTETPNTRAETLETQPIISNQQNASGKRWIWLHIFQSILHIIQIVISYLLMLCAMTYNVWVFLSIIVGAGIGYFLAYPVINRF